MESFLIEKGFKIQNKQPLVAQTDDGMVVTLSDSTCTLSYKNNTFQYIGPAPLDSKFITSYLVSVIDLCNKGQPTSETTIPSAGQQQTGSLDIGMNRQTRQQFDGVPEHRRQDPAIPMVGRGDLAPSFGFPGGTAQQGGSLMGPKHEFFGQTPPNARYDPMHPDTRDPLTKKPKEKYRWLE